MEELKPGVTNMINCPNLIKIISKRIFVVCISSFVMLLLAGATLAQCPTEHLAVILDSSNFPQPISLVPRCTDTPDATPTVINVYSITNATYTSLQATLSGGKTYLTAGILSYETLGNLDTQLGGSGCFNGFQPQLKISFSQPITGFISVMPRSSFSNTYSINNTIQITDSNGNSIVGTGINVSNATFITISAILSPGQAWDFGFQTIEITSPIISAGSIVANPSSALAGSTVNVSGSGWNAPSSPITEYHILFDGQTVRRADGSVVAQPISACSTQPNLSFDIPCNATVGNHSIVCQIVNSSTQQVTLTGSPINFTVTSPPIGALSTVCQITGVQSITFERVDDPSKPLDTNPDWAGGGFKVFPDKDDPKDKEEKVHKRLVKVIARTNLPSDTPIYFKLFDVDDRSTDDLNIDWNGVFGNDNRGTDAALVSDLNNQTPTNSALTHTDSKRGTGTFAEIYLKVTTYPGDNFKVAASENLTYLNSVELDPNNGSIIRDQNGAGTRLPTNQAKLSDYLVVWRRVHIEVDRMSKVLPQPRNNPPSPPNKAEGTILSAVANPDPSRLNTTIVSLVTNAFLRTNRFQNGRIQLIGVTGITLANENALVLENTQDRVVIPRNEILETFFQNNPQPSDNPPTFGLWDDDDYNSNNQGDYPNNLHGDTGESISADPNLTFSRIQQSDDPERNVYADAFIWPVIDGGGNINNNKDNVGFALYLSPNDVPSTINDRTRDSRNNESNDYWVVYILLGYQPAEVAAFDPDVAGAIVTTGNSPVPQINGSTDEISSRDGTPGVPLGAEGSVIHLETCRDLDAGTGNIFRRRETAVPHEMGHQFGLDGDQPNFGIMTDGQELTLIRFVPRHINILRWRVHSPGQ